MSDPLGDVLKDAYPARPVSPALARRVALLADTPTRRRPAPPAWALAACALLLVAVVAGTAVLAPRAAAARALRRSAAALGRARTVHTDGWQRDTDGARRRWRTWSDGVRHRVESDAERMVFDGRRLFRYEADTRRLTVRRASRAFAFVSSGPTVDDLQADLRRWGWRDRIVFLPEERENGQTRRRVRIERDEPAGPVRVEVWVDPATDLPVRTETRLFADGVWQVRAAQRIVVDAPPPRDAFAPLRVPGAPLVDLDALAARRARRLALPLARIRASGRTVAIRSVERDRDGNLFVLYTAGKTPDDAFRTDPDGTRWFVDHADQARDWELRLDGYARRTADFVTDIDPKTRRTTLGMRPVIDGEKLEMDWFAPLADPAPSPRRVVLRVRVGAAGWARAGAAVSPVAGDVPDWWNDWMGDGRRDAVPVSPQTRLRIAAAEARADHRVWSAKGRDLEAGLRWLDTEGRLRPAADPNRADWHLRRATCLGMMGRRGEARREVERAEAAWPASWKDRTSLFTQAAGIYRSLGDARAADACVDRAIAESPKDRAWLERSRSRFRRW